MQLQLSSSPRQFLQLLLLLRLGAILGQSLTIAIVERTLHVALPLAPMLAAIATLALIAAVTALRLRLAFPATQLEIALQLLIDIAQLTVLLYLSGGTTNPFASLYLIPIALSAVGLGWRYLTLTTLSCVAAYAYLVGHSLALEYSGAPSSLAMSSMGTMPSIPSAVSPAFDLHMAGMEVTFLLSCALLATALSIMAAEIRRRDQLAARLREQTLRREHLSAMGILAAGAAHELSTPLLSMSLLVEELQAAASLDTQGRADLSLLGRQIQLCKEKLSTLLQTARQSSLPALQSTSLQALLNEALDQWRLMRPAVHLDVRAEPGMSSELLHVDAGFCHALTSLLDNAADASAACGSDRVTLRIFRDGERLQIAIEDEGRGLSEHLREQAGKAIFTTKSQGGGLGLVLSHANLERLQGELALAARPEGGTRTLITLPLRSVP